MNADPSLTLDPFADVRELLTYPFMVHALEAGTIVAVLAAVVGWYMVLRRQSFAGHTLSVMAFPGATGRRAGRAPECARLLPRVRRGGACAMGRTAPGATAATARDRGDRHRPDGRARRRLPVPVAQPRRPRRAPRPCCSARSSASPPARCWACSRWRSPRWRCSRSVARPLLFATIDREVARARGVPVAPARPGFLLVLALRGGRHQPDHRRAARVRAAGGARRPPPSSSPCDRWPGSSSASLFALLVVVARARASRTSRSIRSAST